MLNNDCLTEIFHYLPIVDRIKIERVSKRWNEVSKSSWNDIKKLNFDPRSWGFKPYHYLLDSKKIGLLELEEVFKRCGKFLEVLDTSEISSRNHKNKILSIVATYCPNIKSLKADGSPSDMAKLAEGCKNIVDLNFLASCSQKRSFIEFSNLFSNNKNLRILKIRIPYQITGSCLSNLPLLEKLDLSYANYGFDKENLITAIKKMNNLKVFKIILFHDHLKDVLIELQNFSNLEELDIVVEGYEENISDNDNLLGAIFKNNQKLAKLGLNNINFYGECLKYLNSGSIKALKLARCQNFEYINFLRYLNKFNNLSKFEFNTYSMSNENFKQLIKFISLLVNLNYLKIGIHGDISEMTNYDSLSSLINLEELHLQGNIINDQNLASFGDYFKNLKRLTLIDCYDVTDSGLYAITSLPNLEELTLFNLYKVTVAGFNKMDNLKKLKCRRCQIKNEGFTKIVGDSEKLDYLYINDCYVTEDFILNANEITERRTNSIVLYIDKCILNEVDTTYLNGILKSPYLEFTNE